MKRLTLKKVLSGFTTPCLFAICPTSWSPVLVYAMTEGVVLCPSAFVTIVGLPPSIAATAELVVPKSMPTTFSHLALTGPLLSLALNPFPVLGVWTYVPLMALVLILACICPLLFILWCIPFVLMVVSIMVAGWLVPS